jgi:ABC-2 type transport system ATP-binding protein
MIELRGLSKSYGNKKAVDQLTLEVPAGMVVALLGPNGAGKTTTIRAITGLTRPSSGSAWVCGVNVWDQPVKAKALIGYIPDRPYLYGKLTARELLRFVSGIRGASAEPKIQNWLDFFDLSDFGSALVESFSHGMRQKLTIIAALLADPPVLVVDEPMVGLDPQAAKQVRDLMVERARKGYTVLLTTHSMELAEAISGQVAVLDHGRLVASGQVEELKRQTQGSTLEDVFFRLLAEEAQ